MRFLGSASLLRNAVSYGGKMIVAPRVCQSIKGCIIIVMGLKSFKPDHSMQAKARTLSG